MQNEYSETKRMKRTKGRQQSKENSLCFLCRIRFQNSNIYSCRNHTRLQNLGNYHENHTITAHHESCRFDSVKPQLMCLALEATCLLQSFRNFYNFSTKLTNAQYVDQVALSQSKLNLSKNISSSAPTDLCSVQMAKLLLNRVMHKPCLLHP